VLLLFSVPTSLLPTSHQAPFDADGDTNMDVQEPPPKLCAPAVCDVDGYKEKRKYRLVRDHHRAIFENLRSKGFVHP
jgi:hypothetical protein